MQYLSEEILDRIERETLNIVFASRSEAIKKYIELWEKCKPPHIKVVNPQKPITADGTQGMKRGIV